jgi:hypothetical protein
METANVTAFLARFRACPDVGGTKRPLMDEVREMTEVVMERFRMAANVVRQEIGPEDRELLAYYESLVASDYDRCHPGDSFEAMKLRARFSKEDQGLLNEWMALAAARAAKLPRGRRAAKVDQAAA